MSTQTVYQVSELLPEIRQLLNLSYPEIWIEGEIASISKPKSGHYYFSLKDSDAQLACVMFKQRVNLLNFEPKVGDLVKIRGKITVYPQTGNLQCQVQHMEDAGEGVLQQRFLVLKNKLLQQGLFNQDNKQAIPNYIQHIGVITSSSGAALHDILSTLKRRAPFIRVTVYPSNVQGDKAANELIDAIKTAHEHNQADALILSRGGGSMQDLWAFNDEQLAYEIHQSRLPIISAVGHEIDFTICDFVSDLRAATPTAAAEILSLDQEKVMEQLSKHKRQLHTVIIRKIEESQQSIDYLSNRLEHPKHSLHRKKEHLMHLINKLQLAYRLPLQSKQTQLAKLSSHFQSDHLKQHIAHSKTILINQQRRLLSQQHAKIDNHQLALSSIAHRLHSVSPLATIKRGYSISRTQSNEVVRSQSQIKPNQNIDVELVDAHLNCKIESITKKQDSTT